MRMMMNRREMKELGVRAGRRNRSVNQSNNQNRHFLKTFKIMGISKQLFCNQIPILSRVEDAHRMF